MSKDRRIFERRKTETLATVGTVEGQDLDPAARVVDLSVNGTRIASTAELQVHNRYRVKLAKTEAWFDIVVCERMGGEYRCRIETSWDDLQDVIRQSDDLTLLVLRSSEIEEDNQ
ncbi:hypothetical protein T8K17_24280 [Thalassobaculum sp. OXR-137]|uniref:hypothetical protein n=1 Tax=Thalassobaculum sp. OXR-137 TaxID=3100173 RepID=UPI002AC9687F|nr:hypothetical protein [Thalassobaculum sp. OXR-137]WPZ34337.1 hypothetical protein T8K17_24280 [Thalassobaculum sp. OXR-137]